MPILTHEERLGTELAGKYRLERIIGRGGMGAVFAGTHTWTGRPVAVKLLNYEYARDEGIVARFLQEARTSAGLKHPNVVDVLDMGALDDGTVYLVLEFLEGQSLSDRLQTQGKLAPDEACDVLLPVMSALAYAHKRGVVHRDLKPDNIFISHDATGRVVPKLLDFGIAKVLDESKQSSTRTGMVLGTPDYMSPEQAAGKALGPASDIWSMGVVWYEVLAGRMPFEGFSGTGLLLAIVSAKPTPLAEAAPTLSAPLVAAIEGALVSDVAGRYATVEDFQNAVLAACREGGLATGMGAAPARRDAIVAPAGPSALAPASASAAASDGHGLAPPVQDGNATPVRPRTGTQTPVGWVGVATGSVPAALAPEPNESTAPGVGAHRASRRTPMIAGAAAVAFVGTALAFVRGAHRAPTPTAPSLASASSQTAIVEPTQGAPPRVAAPAAPAHIAAPAGAPSGPPVVAPSRASELAAGSPSGIARQTPPAARPASPPTVDPPASPRLEPPRPPRAIEAGGAGSSRPPRGGRHRERGHPAEHPGSPAGTSVRPAGHPARDPNAPLTDYE